MKMAALMAVVAMTGCAGVQKGAAGSGGSAETFSVLTIANRASADVCGLYVWSDADESRRADNRLLPGTVLVGRFSDYRMLKGTWRDLVVNGVVDATFHLEARDCDGHVLAAWHREHLAKHDGGFTIR